MISVQERFMSYVDKTNECWEWTAGKRGGYGRFKIHGVQKDAHRVSYELFVGPIPPAMAVCHHCDNRGCVNPAYLFVGTAKDNVQDMIQKGRYANKNSKKTHCKNGHELTGANLYVNPASGSRVCRICSSKSKLEWQRKRRSHE